MEKQTDFKLQLEFNSVFNINYNTEYNPKLFNSKFPDGWKFLDINNKKYLFIIENKSNIKLLNQGKKQLFNYFNNLPFHKLKKTHKIILILGYGSNIDFNYILFKYNMKNNDKIPIETKYKLNHYNKQINQEFDIKQIHELNQYLYDNGINLPKSQKTLFIASILICLKINNKFIDDFDEETNGYSIANKMINSINEFYNDNSFSQSFNFIKKSIHNNKLFELFIKLEKLIDVYGLDILNLFYSEFCIYDRNNDASLGVVLTPDDIVDLMIKELNINPKDTICDFCTGTGSFLIKASQFSKHLIGCENNDERYSLAKCNFILNDLDYSHLYYNSCFNQEFEKYDKVIINPPFSCPNPDSLIELNETNWKDFKKEQKFVLYQIQLLKENGIGCCIIPRGNINNSTKQSNKFKQELLNYVKILKIINCNSKVFVPNASVECVIIVFRKCNKKSNNVKIIDYSEDGYKINKNIRFKEKEGIFKEQIRDLNYNDDWNYEKEINMEIDIKKIVYQYNNTYIYNMNNLYIFLDKYNKINYKNVINYTLNIKWENLKIGDYFDIAKPEKQFLKTQQNGIYPLITRSSINNGITKYINDYSLDGEYLTIAPSGSTGSCFYHNYKFGVDKNIKVLKSNNKNVINLHIWAMMINYILTQKYSYTNGLTNDKILNEIIPIPLFKK